MMHENFVFSELYKMEYIFASVLLYYFLRLKLVEERVIFCFGNIKLKELKVK